VPTRKWCELLLKHEKLMLSYQNIFLTYVVRKRDIFWKWPVWHLPLFIQNTKLQKGCIQFFNASPICTWCDTINLEINTYFKQLWFRISIRARCTTLCGKVCQWLATGRWFSPGPPVSSTNKTNLHYLTEILLKVALNTIKQTKTYFKMSLNILTSISGMLTSPVSAIGPSNIL